MHINNYVLNIILVFNFNLWLFDVVTCHSVCTLYTVLATRKTFQMMNYWGEPERAPH